MKQQTRFYVSRKNPLTWLMALCMVASAVVRIVLACVSRGYFQTKCFGKEDSVKETHQGCLSRSINQFFKLF